MRLLKIILYLLALFIVQTVVAPRLNFLGVIPDLVLVSAIIFAVLAERTPATLFSAAAGLAQDILTAGIYFNLILKVMVSNIVTTLKEEFAGDEYSFSAGMVAIFAPLLLLAQYIVLFFFYEKSFSLPTLLFKLLAGTIYNLLMVPLLFPIIKELTGGKEKE